MSKSNTDQLKAEAYSKLRGCSRSLCEYLLKWLNISENDHILDLGCGPADNTALLSEVSKANVEGLDIDEERFAFAKNAHPELTLHLGNADALPFADESFSVVTMMLSSHRFNDRSKVIDEVKRVLRPGGRIGIVTVTPEQLGRRVEFRSFPTALRIESERFSSWDAHCKELFQHGFFDHGFAEFQEKERPLDGTFLEWLRQYPFSVLRKIPEREFQEGLEAIDKLIREPSKHDVVRDECTVIYGTKPLWTRELPGGFTGAVYDRD